MLCDDVRHVCDTCFDKGKTESCLVKAPAMRTSESVLVVSELLCTGSGKHRETHKGTKRAKCAHVGDTNNNKNHVSVVFQSCTVKCPFVSLSAI